ncbi:MAG: hypothetical protein K0R29_1974 [Pseudobdellovibrio sp.]|jgi:hypothetical protein|nr:hypothetical protein [Pseudobdellovibrio sp.]
MMNHLKPILISFITVATMLAYQNCQKMGFANGESESNQSSLSVDPSTTAIELNYHMGYGACMGRCVTGAKITVDVQAGVMNITNYVMESSFTEAEATSSPALNDIGTKFNLQLNQKQHEALKAALLNLQFEERFVPPCVEDGLCAIMVDNPNFTHFFTDKDGSKRKVFTESGIDPNLRGENFLVMDDASPLACALKAVIEAATLKAQEKEESIKGLETALNFYESYNPLSCAP